MRFRIKPRVVVVAIALLVAVAAFLLWRQRREAVRTDAEIVALLPRRDLMTGFVNVELLRRAGMLALLEGSKPARDADYQRFVRESGFDYSRDIRAIAGAANGQQIFAVIRGTFDWKRLRAYADQSGGNCNTAFCQVPTSRAGRWASFLRIDSDVAGLAIGTEPADVLLLTPRKPETVPAIPAAPIWISVPHAFLTGVDNLPLPVRLLLQAVQAADQVILSANSNAGAAGTIELRLEADFENASASSAARTQLEIDTNSLKMELRRERQQPSRSDLTGILTAGTFQQSGNTVDGIWPVYREFLRRLE